MSEHKSVYPCIFNDLFHDLAAGTFLGTAVAAWLIRRQAENLDAGIIAVKDAAPSLWSVFVFALAVVVLTGLFRLRYWKLNVRAGFLETKREIAVVKHALFVMVFVVSGFALALATR